VPEPLQHVLPSVADATLENLFLFGEEPGTPAGFLCGAEGRRRAALVVDVATPPASQGGADVLERLCFPRRREGPLNVQNKQGAVG